MGADARAVLVQPAAQSRPLADQRLVRDLGGAVAERDQARLGEPLEQRVDAVGRGRALGHQLVARDAPAGVDGALAELGHPQEDAARERLAPSAGRPSITSSAVRAIADVTPPLAR